MQQVIPSLLVPYGGFTRNRQISQGIVDIDMVSRVYGALTRASSHHCMAFWFVAAPCLSASHAWLTYLFQRMATPTDSVFCITALNHTVRPWAPTEQGYASGLRLQGSGISQASVDGIPAVMVALQTRTVHSKVCVFLQRPPFL